MLQRTHTKSTESEDGVVGEFLPLPRAMQTKSGGQNTIENIKKFIIRCLKSSIPPKYVKSTLGQTG